MASDKHIDVAEAAEAAAAEARLSQAGNRLGRLRQSILASEAARLARERKFGELALHAQKEGRKGFRAGAYDVMMQTRDRHSLVSVAAPLALDEQDSAHLRDEQAGRYFHPLAHTRAPCPAAPSHAPPPSSPRSPTPSDARSLARAPQAAQIFWNVVIVELIVNAMTAQTDTETGCDELDASAANASVYNATASGCVGVTGRQARTKSLPQPPSLCQPVASIRVRSPSTRCSRTASGTNRGSRSGSGKFHLSGSRNGGGNLVVNFQSDSNIDRKDQSSSFCKT